MLTLTRKDLLKRTALPEINITTVTILIKEHLCSCHMLGTGEVLRGTPESLRTAAAKVLTFLCMSSRRSKDNTDSGYPTAPESTHGPHPVPASAIPVLATLSPCLSLLWSLLIRSPFSIFQLHSPPSSLFLPSPSHAVFPSSAPRCPFGSRQRTAPLTAKVERCQS